MKGTSIRTRFLNPGLLDFLRKLFKKKSEELGEIQISLHKIVHVDWLKFCALRNKMDNKRMGKCQREPGCQRSQLGSSS